MKKSLFLTAGLLAAVTLSAAPALPATLKVPASIKEIPEADKYTVLYQIDALKNKFVINHGDEVSGKITRVAYFLKIVDQKGKTSWVFTAMDAFEQDPLKLGRPTPTSGIIQRYVTNLEVASNVPGVKTGKFEKGNIEFWNCNYGAYNVARIPGANNNAYDFGDIADKATLKGGHGSMQVHNYLHKQTVFAWNNWRGGKGADLGIGNSDGPHKDWTFSKAGIKYKTATLFVLAKIDSLKYTKRKAPVFNLSDFGGKADGKSDNLNAFIKAFATMKKVPGSTLRLNKGTYRISSKEQRHFHETFHLIIRGLNKATIEGNGAKLVFTDPERGGFLFINSDNLTIKGISIDWDPIAFTQGVISKTDVKNHTFEYTIEPGFPPADNKNFKNYAPEGKHMIGFIYDQTTRKLLSIKAKDDYKGVSKVEKLDKNRFRIHIRKNQSMDGFADGRLFVLISRNPSNGMVFHHCANLLLKDITMYSSSHIGFNFRNGCVKPRLENVQIRILPGSRRMISSNADSFYFDGCTEPTAVNCHLEGGMDDGFVLPVHGRYIAYKVDAKTYKVRYTWCVPLYKGNQIEGLDLVTGKRIEGLPKIASVTVRKVEKINGKSIGEVETITLEQPTDKLKVGDQIYNLSFSNQNFRIENCTVKNLRGKGVKVHGNHGVVRNCTIDSTTFGGIEIGLQIPHPKAPWVFMWADDILIENNTIRNAATLGLIHPTPVGWATAIRIHQGPDGLKEHPNRNIRIINNTIENSGQSALRCWASQNVQVTGNKIGKFNLMKFPHETMPMEFINTVNVVNRNNKVTAK